ncbi:hypothetical protein ScPMuIL_017631 [Solemya velum]
MDFSRLYTCVTPVVCSQYRMSDWVIVQHPPTDKVGGHSGPKQHSQNSSNFGTSNCGNSVSRKNSGGSSRTHSLSFEEQILLPGEEDITRKHWKSTDNCTTCRNKECRKKFSIIERPHHCRRCGNVFCSNCLKFKRNLNKLANPEPDGKKFQVCQSCFDEGRDTEGCKRILTGEFIWLRKRCKEEKLRLKYGNLPNCISWRDKLDLDLESKRLKEGFKASIGTSEMKRTLQEMSTVLTTPDWHKSSFWMQANMPENCQTCMTGFGLMKKKHNCKMCGLVLCKSCSSKELLVYLPDDRNPSEPPEPQLAIIKIVGCPEVEPEISLNLRICGGCKENLINRQVTAYYSTADIQASGEVVMATLVSLQDQFRKIQEKIDALLYEYGEIVESLEDSQQKSKSIGDSRNNMKILAKSQEDISDYFSQLVLKIQQLKGLKPETDTQTVLTKNIRKCKSEYYLDNMYTFRCLKKKLDMAAPTEVLEYIQRTVDRNAIVSTQLYIRQLLFETLHICEKHRLKEQFPQLLSPLDEMLEREVASCLTRSGEDLDQHSTDLNVMLKGQLKAHRLICPSRRGLKEQGAMHAAAVTLKRTTEILEQVKVQLCMKSVNKSFLVQNLC